MPYAESRLSSSTESARKCRGTDRYQVLNDPLHCGVLSRRKRAADRWPMHLHLSGCSLLDRCRGGG